MTRLLLTLFLGAALTTPLRAQAPSAEQLARQVQQHYDKVTAFTANFAQTYKGGLSSRERRAEGTVQVKKPGKMRWEFTRPERERQLIVSDGSVIQVYSYDDKVLQKSAVPPDDQAPTAMLFLAGKGNITRDFVVSNTPSPVAGALAIKLTPKQQEPDYEFLILVLEPGTGRIREIHTRDLLGAEVRLSFSNMKENVQIPDRTFSFTPPRDANILGEEQPR